MSEPRRTSGNADWVITVYDEETTETPNVEIELKRLKVLKTYGLLGRERMECYDRITELATMHFKAPMALIALVDLGRYWHVAYTGMPIDHKREWPRRTCLGAHTVLSKNSEVFVVTDARNDARFIENPLVHGPPYIRFYAGAPLVSPEGCKLGAISVMDTELRNWTDADSQTLASFSKMVMDLMEAHRASRRQSLSHSLKVLQQSSTMLQQYLNELESDNMMVSSLKEHQRQILHQATEQAKFLSSTLGGQSAFASNNDIAPSTLERVSEKPRRSDNPNMPPQVEDRVVGKVMAINMANFVKNVEFVMDSYPKKVHLFISLDPSVPARLMFNDLKVFRSTLALLTSACERTRLGWINLRIFSRNSSSSMGKDIVFECEDTSPNVAFNFDSLVSGEDEAFAWETDCVGFDPETGKIRANTCSQQIDSNGAVKQIAAAMQAVSRYMNSMGGNFGFRMRTPTNVKDDHGTGSVFWFSFPLRHATAASMSDVRSSESVGEAPARGNPNSLFPYT